MHCAEAVASVQKVVRLAQQAEIRSVGCAEPCKGLDVVELEKRPGIAASPVRRDERALTTISTVGFSPHRRGQIAPTFPGRSRAAFALRGLGRGRRHENSTWWSRPRSVARWLRLGLRPTRLRTDAETSLLFLSDEARRHEFHQACEIPVRQSVTGKRPRALDQLAQLGVGSEVDTEAIGRKRLELTSAARAGNRGSAWALPDTHWNYRYFCRRGDRRSGQGEPVGRLRRRPDWLCRFDWFAGSAWHWETHWQAKDLLSYVRAWEPRSEQFLNLSPSLTLARSE